MEQVELPLLLEDTRTNVLVKPVGIGLMIAQSLEANGAIVYIIGRRRDVLEQAAKTAVRTPIFFSKMSHWPVC